MEDPSVKALHNAVIYSHSQQMCEIGDNAVDYSEKTLDSKEQSEKKDKIIERNKNTYITTRIKYSATRIKSRKFLSNISCTGVSKNDFYNENFILDAYMLIAKNLNPFSLNKKITDKTNQAMVNMLSEECIPPEFFKYIREEQNFMYLNGSDVNHPRVLEIVGNFIDQGKENFRVLQEFLYRYKDIYQYIYSHVFPEIYTTSEKRGFNLRSYFHRLFKAYPDKQMIRHPPAKKSKI